MYIASIVLFLLIAPAASVLIDAAMHGGALWPLVAKWFVVWPVGVRLFVAGARQVAQPSFTSEVIFNIHDPVARLIVRELGFGNLSIGTLGLLSLVQPDWMIAAAITGGLYYGLAGLGHLAHGDRNPKQNAALISDLLIAALLAAIVVRSLTA